MHAYNLQGRLKEAYLPVSFSNNFRDLPKNGTVKCSDSTCKKEIPQWEIGVNY